MDYDEMGEEEEERAMAEALELNRKLKELALAGGDDIQAYLQQQMGQQQYEDDGYALQQEQYDRQQRHLEMKQQMLAAEMRGGDGYNDGNGGIQGDIEQRAMMRAHARQENGGIRKGGGGGGGGGGAAARKKSNYSK
jgi:hypothetical protein